MSRLNEVAGVAIETLKTVADDLTTIELAAVIEPPPFETLAERKARRERVVGRLGEARVAVVAAVEMLKREREQF